MELNFLPLYDSQTQSLCYIAANNISYIGQTENGTMIRFNGDTNPVFVTMPVDKLLSMIKNL